MPPRNRIPPTSRELTVMILAGIILVVSPWGWAGVVLWTVCAALGFAAAALLAVVAEADTQRKAMVVWFLGLLVALLAAGLEGYEPLSHRWLDYVCFPACAFVGSSIALFLLSRDLNPRPAAEARRELLRSVPFWAGIALFAYFAVQDLNAWGVAVDREAFWAKQGLPGIEVGQFDIRPLPYVHWLPSGLKAPFSAADTLHAPMNAWRLMMILAAPWMLFCALRHGLRRRRRYVTLAHISVVAACVLGAFCVLNRHSSGTILGFPIPENTRCFGPFISRNHAGVYFYLHVALALGLTFWYIRRSGEGSLRGGPYLVTGFLAFVLAVFASITASVAAAGVVLVLILLSTPLVYFFGFPDSRGSRRGIMIATAAAMLVAAGAVLSVADLKPITNSVKNKTNTFLKTGVDDREPMRRVTWALIDDAGWDGRAWVGYGAGSFRWISPPYQAEQKELQHTGRLYYRADYAHNDWLEMLATWGVVGLLPVLALLGWLSRWLVRAFHEGHPETVPLALVLILLGAHASLDLLFWFTPLMFAAVFVAAAMICLTDRSSAETNRENA